jgi:hypothetical protein
MTPQADRGALHSVLLQARSYREIMLMQIYWSFKSIPELARLPSEERGRVWRAAIWKTTRRWQYWASLAGVVLCGEIGRHIYGSIGTIIAAVVSSFIFAQVATRLARPYMRALLSGEQA